VLVLTRKAGQKLVIDNNIQVVVLEVRGDTVKIGVDAPKTVSIYREELYNEIKQSNQQASTNVASTVLDSASNLLPSQSTSQLPSPPAPQH